jgi:hypothetical protein
MLFKGSLVQLASAMALLVLPVTPQTSQELRQRYGNPDAERYVVRPGIVMTVAFAKDGQPCEMVIEPWHSVVPNDTSPKLMPSDKVTEIIDEVLPLTQRGKLLRDISFTGGCNLIRTADYETVTITRTIRCKPDGGVWESPVQIRFKASRCK